MAKNIDDFYGSNPKNIIYNDGYCDTISDFYNNFICDESRMISDSYLKQWHDLLVNYYYRTDNPVFFIRKYESAGQKGSWNTRRGAVVRFKNGVEIVYSSNFLAHDIYLMAFNKFCPSLEDFEDCIKNRKLRNTIGTEADRAVALYPGQNKILKCYLAHIAGVNSDPYIRNDGTIKKISRIEAEHLFPIGKIDDWNNPEKIFSVDYALNDEEIEILKADSLRLLDPLNYFLTPQTKNCEHDIIGFKKNIGEYGPLIDYVFEERKKRFPKEFNEFITLCRYQHDSIKGSNVIKLKYNKKEKYSKKVPAKDQKIRVINYKYSENEKIDLAYYFLNNNTTYKELDASVLKCPTDRHGNTSFTILKSLGITTEKKNILSKTNITDEIGRASGPYKNTLLKIKSKYKIITVNEIDKVLDEALSDYKLGKTQCKNIIFVGNDGIGKSSRINRWMETHSGEVTPVCLTTAPLWKEENGILVKDLKNGKPQYVLGVPPEGLLEDGAIGFCKNLNYSSDECIQPLEQIFSDRTYCFPGMDNKQDLHKLFLIIATAYPDDYGHYGYNLADISNIKKCSDVYTVTPSVDESIEYLHNKLQAELKSIIEAGKKDN